MCPFTDPEGTFGPSTRAAVEAFQRQRGIRIDGIAGRQTWATLIEAGLALGDRPLYRTHPMLRGDDVADLQGRLCSLGFDTGRVDGIFGDNTAAAVAVFQRNVQLPIDGIAGRLTVDELFRVTARHQTFSPVTPLREAERRRLEPTTLRGRHIGVGESGGLGTVAGALTRRLAAAGARVTLLGHPDESAQAQEANAAEVDAFIGLRLSPATLGCKLSFWSGYATESARGRELAMAMVAKVPIVVGGAGSVEGMSLAVLRETQMPAVMVEVGPLETVIERSGPLADALASAISAWAES